MSFTPGGRPPRQDSYQSLQRNHERRIKALEDFARSQGYSSSFFLNGPPTAPGQVATWTGPQTGWLPEFPTPATNDPLGSALGVLRVAGPSNAPISASASTSIDIIVPQWAERRFWRVVVGLIVQHPDISKLACTFNDVQQVTYNTPISLFAAGSFDQEANLGDPSAPNDPDAFIYFSDLSQPDHQLTGSSAQSPGWWKSAVFPNAPTIHEGIYAPLTLDPNGGQWARELWDYANDPTADFRLVFTDTAGQVGVLISSVVYLISGEFEAIRGYIPSTPVIPQPIELNALDYGVKGDGQITYVASMNAGSNIINIPGASFTQANIGNIVAINGALSTGPDGNTLIGHITAVNSPTQAVLDQTSQYNTGQTTCVYGTDDTNSLNNLPRGRSVRLPGNHIYLTSNTVTVANELRGDGPSTLVVACALHDVFSITTPGYRGTANIIDGNSLARQGSVRDMSIGTILNISYYLVSPPAIPQNYSQFAVTVTESLVNTNDFIPEIVVDGIVTGYAPYNIQPTFQGICIGGALWTTNTAVEIPVAGCKIDNCSIITQFGHGIFINGGANSRGNGIIKIGENVWLSNLYNADGAVNKYDPAIQIVQSGQVYIYGSQDLPANSNHGIVIGGNAPNGQAYPCAIDKIHIEGGVWQDICVVLDYYNTTNYLGALITDGAVVGHIIIDDVVVSSIDFSTYHPQSGYEKSGSLEIIGRNTSGNAPYNNTAILLQSLIVRDSQINGRINIDLDPALVATSNPYPSGHSGNPVINIHDNAVQAASGTTSMPDLGQIHVHANTQNFKLRGNRANRGIAIDAGSSDGYIITENDVNNAGVADGGTGTRKLVANNI